MKGITVTQRNETLVACKSAAPQDAHRLKQEAEHLRRLEHPGVVQFVDFCEGEQVELLTTFVGPDSWASLPPETFVETVEALASLASTVADLHSVGTAHGSLIAEHVLLTPDKRPILCGFADASTANETSCLADLKSLAKLMDQLGLVCSDKERKRLDSLARRVERNTLSAQDLTNELNRLHASPTYARSRLPSFRFSVTNRKVATLGLTFLVLGVAAVFWLRSTTDTHQQSAPPLNTNTALQTSPPTSQPQASHNNATSSDSTSSSDSSSSATGEAQVTPTSIAALPTDTNNARQQSGNLEDNRLIVNHQGRRYGVGQKGDVALLGDWTCSGEATLALLQLASGTIAVFASWPGPAEQLESGYVTVVEGANGLRNDPIRGCDQLRVTHPGGSTLIETEFS